MNRFKWMIRRELWESRSIWMGPAIAVAVLTLTSLFGLSGLEHVQFDPRFDAMKQHKLIGAIYFGVTMLFFMIALFSMFFYSLDSLYGDRRDRSVLFWKSLPISDAETVLSKAATAILVVPAVAAAGAILGQWGVALAGTAKFGSALMLDPAALGAGMLFAVYAAIAFALWYAPLVGYLLAWSAWAPRSPFLYAVVPPAVLALGEKILFGSSYIAHLVNDRAFGGVSRALGMDGGGIGIVIREEDMHVNGADAIGNIASRFFVAPELWLGLVVAAALVAATIWIRRYRDESL